MATYYVNQSSGNDSNAGTSTGAAWKTLSKVAGKGAAFFQPDDQILFNKGDTWNEQLTWPDSNLGTAGHPIILSTYGSGAAPRFKGCDTLTAGSFTLSAGQSFTYQQALSTNPSDIVLEDGTRLTLESSIAAVEANAGSFWWSANIVYIHPTDNSNPTSSGKVYESAKRTNCIAINGNSSAYGHTDYITVDGFEVMGTLEAGVHVKHSKGVTVQNCVAHDCQQWGLVFGSEGSLLNDTGALTSNTTYNNRQFGGQGGGALTSFIVTNPTSYNNGRATFTDHNVYLSYGDNITCTGGLAYGAAAHNYKFGGSVTGGKITYCVSYNAAQAGFFADQGTTGVSFYHNTDDGSLYGLWEYTGGTAVAIVNVENCIFANNTQYGYYTNNANTITLFGHNDVYGAASSNYQGITSQTGTNGNISADPAFLNRSAHDYHILKTSPCVNAGVVVNGVTNLASGSAPDIGRYEYYRPLPGGNRTTLGQAATNGTTTIGDAS